MKYELAKKLKEANYPFTEHHLGITFLDGVPAAGPSLEELIKEVGFCFATLQQEHKDRTPEGYLKFSGWKALATDATCGWVGKGLTPEIAVAELWLNIKNNVYEYSEPPIFGVQLRGEELSNDKPELVNGNEPRIDSQPLDETIIKKIDDWNEDINKSENATAAKKLKNGAVVHYAKQHAKKCPQFDSSERICECDGYHTFGELYEHRIILWIALCKTMYANSQYREGLKVDVWRSKLHADGTSFDGWFILGMGRHKGKQMTYHLPIPKWESTNFAETRKKAPKFDGHTSDDVLERLKKL